MYQPPLVCYGLLQTEEIYWGHSFEKPSPTPGCSLKEGLVDGGQTNRLAQFKGLNRGKHI